MVTFGSVKEKEYMLLEQDEYVLTLHELEESEGQWGDRMIWKFLVAPKEDYSAYICKANGDEYELWAFTDRDITLGSMAHEFAQVLSGRKLEKDDQPPDEDDLIGKRCLAYVTHETPTRGKSAGKKREAIVAGSIKPFKGPAKTVARNVAPTKPSQQDVDHAEWVEKAGRLIGKCVKLETPNHAAYVALDLEDSDADQLQQLCVTLQNEISAALDG